MRLRPGGGSHYRELGRCPCREGDVGEQGAGPDDLSASFGAAAPSDRDVRAEAPIASTTLPLNASGEIRQPLVGVDSQPQDWAECASTTHSHLAGLGRLHLAEAAAFKSLVPIAEEGQRQVPTLLRLPPDLSELLPQGLQMPLYGFGDEPRQPDRGEES